MRTVHGYFPSRESRVEALAEWLDAQLYEEPVPTPTSIDDLPDHFRRIHRSALDLPLAAALLGGAALQAAHLVERLLVARLV